MSILDRLDAGVPSSVGATAILLHDAREVLGELLHALKWMVNDSMYKWHPEATDAALAAIAKAEGTDDTVRFPTAQE